MEGAATVFDELIEQVLSAKKFHVEQALAAQFNRIVTTILGDPDRTVEQRQIARRMAQIVSILPNRREFAKEHNHQMMIRLFQYAAQQWKTESKVYQEIESFLPGDFMDWFQDKVPDFEESDKVNKEWKETAPDSPLSVFVLPKLKARDIALASAFPTPTAFFLRHTAPFELFYKTRQKTAGTIQWLYADNQVVLRVLKGKMDIQLTMPLVAAAVLVAVKELGNPTVAEVAAAVRWEVQRVVAMIRKFLPSPRPTGADFPMLKVTGNLEDQTGRVTYNPFFDPKRKRYTITADGYSLRPAASAPPPTAENGDLYKANIVFFIKRNRRMDMNALRQHVQAKITQMRRGRPEFKEEAFQAAITQLQAEGYIAKDAKNPTRFVFNAD
jgi:hypothetical protein